MSRIIFKEKIQATDSRLKRHIEHDSESRRYAYVPKHYTLTSVVHTRHIPILDQGQLGSCTGNAGVGALSIDPMFSVTPKSIKYSLDEKGAVSLYSDAEVIDGSGAYPPNDNGSSGLSIAKALKSAGLISGYQHAFTLNDALAALVAGPIMVGINWYDRMFTPDADGRVHPAGKVVGGHEIVARELDSLNSRVWFDNSWGAGWGKGGRFYLTYADFGTLLSQQGDVTVLVPLTSPAPTPTPTPTVKDPADVALAKAMTDWIKAKGL